MGHLKQMVNKIVKVLMEYIFQIKNYIIYADYVME